MGVHSSTQHPTINMLFFLAILSVSSALPQYINYPVPLYTAVQQYHQPHHVYSIPHAQYTVQQPPHHVYSPVEHAITNNNNARLFFNTNDLQYASGSFIKDAAAGHTFEGSITFRQNPFTGSNSDYFVSFKGGMPNMTYKLVLRNTCTGADIMEIGQHRTPFFLLNSWFAKGSSTKMNIDGTDGKQTVVGNVVVIIDEANKVVGCTVALKKH